MQCAFLHGEKYGTFLRDFVLFHLIIYLQNTLDTKKNNIGKTSIIFEHLLQVDIQNVEMYLSGFGIHFIQYFAADWLHILCEV